MYVHTDVFAIKNSLRRCPDLIGTYNNNTYSYTYVCILDRNYNKYAFIWVLF